MAPGVWAAAATRPLGVEVADVEAVTAGDVGALCAARPSASSSWVGAPRLSLPGLLRKTSASTQSGNTSKAAWRACSARVSLCSSLHAALSGPAAATTTPSWTRNRGVWSPSALSGFTGTGAHAPPCATARPRSVATLAANASGGCLAGQTNGTGAGFAGGCTCTAAAGGLADSWGIDVDLLDNAEADGPCMHTTGCGVGMATCTLAGGVGMARPTGSDGTCAMVW
mmetsp:Transcript_35143/g.97206  ORF Transcript_35143/g.97206 Transcript_35143/m.97206 type:complete len:226 (-) Transcript_35143:467-1144(-)